MRNSKDAIRQLHLAIMVTFEASAAVKIFENSEDAALIRVRPSYNLLSTSDKPRQRLIWGIIFTYPLRSVYKNPH